LRHSPERHHVIATSGVGSRDLAWVNPADVVKIEVQKNPTDIGIYGRRGANGVIVVTTKRP